MAAKSCLALQVPTLMVCRPCAALQLELLLSMLLLLPLALLLLLLLLAPRCTANRRFCTMSAK